MDIADLQHLAGIRNKFTGYSEYQLEENPSETATELKQKEREMGLKPGDPDWFKLWFSKPYMTGPVQFRGRKKK
jgi:hypothetical protein